MLILLLAPMLVLGQEPSERLPVPEVAPQKDAEKLIRDVFKDDYAKKSASDRVTLAKKLLAQGLQTADDPVSQFVLFREAKDIAVAAGDLETAENAVQETARRYDVDGVALKMTLFATAAKAAKTAEESLSLARAYLKLVDQAIELEQFEQAEKVASEASALARKGKDLSLATKADARKKDIADLRNRSDKLRKARETLRTSPDDPPANLAVGQFECFVKGDWARGLPLLAKGSHPALKALAERDLAGANDSAAKASLGDGWWDLAEKEKEGARSNLRMRALHWYEQAFPGVAGLTQAKLGRRISELQFDRFGGTWIDVTDPARFNLAGKSGDPIVIEARPNDPKVADLGKFPPGDFDGVSVRMDFGSGPRPVGMLCFEGVQRGFYISTGSRTAKVSHVEGESYKVDKSVGVIDKQEYVLTVILAAGEYLLYVDGKEVDRIKTALSRLAGIRLQADHAAVKFDQIKLRKKE